MGVKSDEWIKRQVIEQGIIEPFVDEQVKGGVISYGLSAYGYDFRVANEFKIPIPHEPRTTNHKPQTTITDPKASRKEDFEDVVKSDYIAVPPNSYILARSLEYFKMPRDCIGICIGKSTYARCGIVLNITPLEPEWEGHITISIANTSGCPVKIYAFEGIGQVVFLSADSICSVSYKDKSGKYQAQKGVTLAKVAA